MDGNIRKKCEREITMKKILWLVVLAVITLAISIYALCAGITVKGVDIYLVSYNVGRVFAATYIISGILAVAGWIFLLICVMKMIRQWLNSDKKKTEVEEKTSDAGQEKLEAKEKALNTEQKQEAEVKCAGCGAILISGAKFCTKCGKKVE